MGARGDMMEAEALVARQGGQFELDGVLVPRGDDRIVVETASSGISIGTEFGVLRGKIDWGQFPMVTGYMATGRVVDVGRNVNGFEVGDRVYVRRNDGLMSLSGEPVNARSGTHCSLISLNPSGTHGAALLPEKVTDDAGSVFTVLSVGLYGVDLAGVSVGNTVVTIGLGAIGLAVVAAATMRGARVIGVDLREECCAAALGLGAADVVVPSGGRLEEAVRPVVGEEGADYVFEATGNPALVNEGIRLTKPFGSFVWQGYYGDGDIGFRFREAHHRRLRMVFPCDDGYQPYRLATMRSLELGHIDAERLISRRLVPKEAPRFYSDVYRVGSGGLITAVIQWKSQ